MADGPIRTRINTGENTFQSNLGALSNIAPAATDIASAAAGPANFNPGDIPSVGYLANLQASMKQASETRKGAANTAINALPQYVKGYRSYLKWRYPNRYGGGSGSTYGYTGNSSGGGSTDYTAGLTLPNVAAPPSYGG